LLLAGAGAAGAVPFVYQLGPERLVLETPPGFSDALSYASPRLNELAESLTSASNRILVFAIADSDARRFSTGERLQLRRYMIIATPKGLERERVSADDFARIVNDSLREVGTPVKETDYQKFLDKQEAGRGFLLSELRRDPAVVSVLQGAKLPDDTRILDRRDYSQLLSTTTVILLRGKALNLAVFTGYAVPQDLEWLLDTTRRWVDELLRLNNR